MLYCKKKGHRADVCFKKKRDKEKNENKESASTAQDKDKDGEVGFTTLEEELCFTAIDEVEIIEDKEKEGPAQKLDVLGVGVIKYDCFNLGLTRYSWNCIP